MRLAALLLVSACCSGPPPDIEPARQEYGFRLFMCAAEQRRLARASTAKEREYASLAADFQCRMAAERRDAFMSVCRVAYDDLRCQAEADRVRHGGAL